MIGVGAFSFAQLTPPAHYRGYPCRLRSWKKSSMTWSCPERAISS